MRWALCARSAWVVAFAAPPWAAHGAPGASLWRLHAEDEPKNVELLLSVAMLTRSLRGGRLTMCKSGKDRTSMGVTLEHGRLLEAQHGLAAAATPAAVQAMRRRGVRRAGQFHRHALGHKGVPFVVVVRLGRQWRRFWGRLRLGLFHGAGQPEGLQLRRVG